MKVAGVIGWPVAHSKSPLIHRFWLDALGLDGDYVRLPVRPEALASALAGLAPLGFSGVNVTLPHKVEALHACASLDPNARATGAVNLLTVRDDGRLHGANSDVDGVIESLAGWGGGHAVLVGAGGAARAAVQALARLGVTSLTILNRNQESARALLARSGLPGEVLPLDAPLPPATLLVNASSLGMAGQPSYLPDLGPLAEGAILFDMVYAPLETPLLAAGRARGLAAIDGLAMLIGQARAAFRAFYGAEAPRHLDPELRALLSGDLPGNPSGGAAQR
ncbi:shikimate dehydrogenase family protein [Thermaurantiacus sp.]